MADANPKHCKSTVSLLGNIKSIGIYGHWNWIYEKFILMEEGQRDMATAHLNLKLMWALNL